MPGEVLDIFANAFSYATHFRQERGGHCLRNTKAYKQIKQKIKALSVRGRCAGVPVWVGKLKSKW